MQEISEPDLAELRRWIGRTESYHDVLTPRIAAEFAATLDLPGMQGQDVAFMIHWCLGVPIVGAGGLGADGHPRRGGPLPPVPLPRRMWASGRLEFHDRLIAGDNVVRQSFIADVSMKKGRTGLLCFVTVDHRISSQRGLAVEEQQLIVYRSGDLTEPTPTPPEAGSQSPDHRRALRIDTVTLFRYSALTFNGHRIHFDRSYATEVEHYPGLVVHGPLQATLLAGLAASVLGRPLSEFQFRALHPLYDGTQCQLCAHPDAEGLNLWIETQDGVHSMAARAR